MTKNDFLLVAACVLSFVAFGPGGFFVSLFLLMQKGAE